MKHLKWFIALVALLVVPLGIEATPASAGTNCQVGEGATYWNGFLNFQAWIGYCTLDTTEVQFYTLSEGQGSGWFDGAVGEPFPYKYETFSNGSHYAPSAGEMNIQTGIATIIYGRNAWCGGQTHPVQTFFYYRLQGGVTWGPWHQRLSAPYNIVC